jgi:signal transduction histidine kinase
MSWVTIIWSMIASVSFTLATIYLLIWFRERRSWAYLCFFVLAAGVIGMSAGEFGAMYAKSPAEYGAAIRWGHFAYGFIAVGSLGFVHFYFGTGKVWLLGAALGLRLLAVVMNFSTGLNLHIRAIQSLQSVNFLGEPVSMLGAWTPNPWVRLGQFAALVQFVYVVDASLRLWRTGARESRRRALMVGGTLGFFILFASAQAGLVAAGVLRMPIIVSFPFLAVLLAMSCELSRDALRAAQLGRELRESEARMSLAANAAGLHHWQWDIVRDELWATDKGRMRSSPAQPEPKGFNQFLQSLHPDDREPVSHAVGKSMNGDGEYESEYRVLRPDGSIRWMVSRGRVEFNGAGRPVLMRGVSLDITLRKQAEQEIAQQRNEVAHLARVTTLGEISGSLAHELNQPLGAILANTDAAELHLQSQTPNLDEVRAILADIRKDDLRAGEIIHGIRAFLRRRELEKQPLEVAQLVEEAVRLIGADAVSRKTSVGLEIPPGLPRVTGDRIHLQQVVLNLLVNGMDAVSTCPVANRRITIRAARPDPHTVEIAVSDAGVGIPPGDLHRVFDPFHTTKQGGLGLGLAICRSIVEAHGGSISVQNNPDRGATARFSLPVAGTSGEGQVADGGSEQ